MAAAHLPAGREHELGAGVVAAQEGVEIAAVPRALLGAQDVQDRGAIVGALIMSTPQSHPGRTDVIWKTLLGNDAGGLGCVGVAEAPRAYGAGTALVARGIEIIRERGVQTGFIGWTTLRSFYGRHGLPRLASVYDGEQGEF